MDRTGQTWAEHGVVFVVVGAPSFDEGTGCELHPVCVLDGANVVKDSESVMFEGDIPWERMPYMQRVG